MSVYNSVYVVFATLVSSWFEGYVMAQDVEACCDCLMCVLEFFFSKPFASCVQVNTRMCGY
jgi:hypothetical protein